MCLVAAAFLLLIPVSAKDSAGMSMSCGTPASADQAAERDYFLEQRRQALAATLDVVTGKPTGPGYGTPAGGYFEPTPPDCDGARSSRRTGALLGLSLGVVLVVGAAIVRTNPQPARDDADDSPVD